MKKRKIKSTSSQRHGFSLVEVAIVLGVVGLILGGIWTALSFVHEASQQGIAANQIYLVVSNVRASYAGQMGIGETDVSSQMINVGSIPLNMKRSGCACADNPWGENTSYANGTFRVCGWNLDTATSCDSGGGGTAQYFAVELSGLSAASCQALATRISSSTGATGFIDVVINAYDFRHNSKIVQPLSNSLAAGQCVAAGNVVDFVYALKAPSS